VGPPCVAIDAHEDLGPVLGDRPEERREAGARGVFRLRRHRILEIEHRHVRPGFQETRDRFRVVRGNYHPGAPRHDLSPFASYSSRMLAWRTSLAYLARSVLISAANCGGPPGSGSAPIASNCSVISGVLRARVISCDSLSMMALGVPAGARMPCHDFISYPGKPPSAKVGTSGRETRRLLPEIAMPRALPLFTMGINGSALFMNICTWPPIRSVVAGPAPLCGICCILIPAMMQN